MEYRELVEEFKKMINLEGLVEEGGVMQVQCDKKDCRFRSDKGDCKADAVHINDQGICENYEKDERKAIIKHNERARDLLTKVLNSDLDGGTKKLASLALVLSMKTEDGEYVADKLPKKLR